MPSHPVLRPLPEDIHGTLVTRLLTFSVSLVLLFGIAFVASATTPPAFHGADLAILIGFVLLIANVAGGLAASVGLPRLTGYLLVGIVAGPSVLGLMSVESVADLRLIDEFALALIALLAGGELKVAALRPQARSILTSTLSITVVVWIGIVLLMMLIRPLVPFLAEAPLQTSLGVGLLLGIWAANSSPDLTVAVIEEAGVKGAYTDVVLGITIVKDVFVIVLFTLTLSLVGPLLDPGVHLSAHVLVDLLHHVGGALVAGAALGWVFSKYLEGSDEPRSPLMIFLFAYVMVVVADRLGVELLLMAVAAGFTIENLSDAGDRMIHGIEQVAVVIFAFFFVVAGASLDLFAVREFWLAALLVFGARFLLTRLGTGWGLRRAGADSAIQQRAWKGLISQGGVTLGLILLIEETYPGIGPGVVALGTAVIIGNILGGPILLKTALGEVDQEASPSLRSGSEVGCK